MNPNLEQIPSQSKEYLDAGCNETTFFKYQVHKKYQNCSLETCTELSPILLEFGKNWAKKPFSLFLFGNYGTGKTYYAFSLIREMFRRCPKKIWPRYFTSPDLDARLLAASKSEKGDREEIFDRSREDLLFIDDMGREIKSERLKRQYFEIFDYRYSQELPTIITSNFSLDKLGEVIDGAIASRMQEWQSIHFSGSDLRKPPILKV